MLQIDNLHATVAGKPILNGLTLAVNAGEVHAIMGPNGAGKSTLAYVLGGRPGYEVTEGSVSFDGRDLLDMAPDERAAAGLFLGFQYPVEIPGVSNVQFLRTALNAQRRARGEAEISAGDFLRLTREQARCAGHVDGHDEAQRERRFLGRREEAQRDGPDGHHRPAPGGARRDRLGPRHRRSAGGGRRHQPDHAPPDKAVLLITHYQRLLDLVVPDFVHVLAEGRIVRSGGPELAHQLEREGYGEMAA